MNTHTHTLKFIIIDVIQRSNQIYKLQILKDSLKLPNNSPNFKFIQILKKP